MHMDGCTYTYMYTSAAASASADIRVYCRFEFPRINIYVFQPIQLQSFDCVDPQPSRSPYKTQPQRPQAPEKARKRDTPQPYARSGQHDVLATADIYACRIDT
jgi:hypothetical protein